MNKDYSSIQPDTTSDERMNTGGAIEAKYIGAGSRFTGTKGEAYYNVQDDVWYYRTVTWINRNKKGEQKIVGEWTRIPNPTKLDICAEE